MPRSDRTTRNSETFDDREGAPGGGGPAGLSEREAAAAFENAPVALYVADRGGIVRANGAGLRLGGYGSQEELPDDLGALLAETRARDAESGERIAAEQGVIRGALAGTAGEREVLMRHPRTGDERVLLVRAAPVPGDAGEPKAVVALLDVTEQRRAERERERAREELESERAYLQAVIDSTPNPLFVKDAGGRYILASPALGDFFGVPPETIVGKTDAELGFGPEEVRQYDEVDERVRETGETVFIPAVPMTSPHTGETRWFETRKVPLPSAAGGRQVLGLITDVTERRRMEEQLLQAHKMEAVGRMAGGIAHDFNNMLSAIKGNASLALMDLEPEHPVRVELEEIDAAAERAAVLTRHLLTVSRSQVLEPERVDLAALVREAIPIVRRIVGTEIEVVTRIGEGCGIVEADPGHLEQVLINLVTNARDATPAGGSITIEVGPAAGGEGEAAEAERAVALSVTDTGPGIPDAVLPRIFDPFFTTKPRGRGTGLGLSTVRGAVEQSGGRVTVETEPGRGSTFSVHLPCIEERPPARSEERGTAAASPSGPATVLVAEDDASLRRIARRVLERSGYRVLEAANGREALAVAAEHTGEIDVLLTDVVMPQMGGRELSERLAETRPRTRVVFMSGYTDGQIEAVAGGSAGSTFLQKPFEPPALLEAIDAAVGGR